MAEVRSSAGWKVTVAFVVGAVFGAITVAQVAPNLTSTSALEPGVGAETPGATTGSGTPIVTPTGTISPGTGQPGPGPGRPGLVCARGRNGGATDTGVTATEIKLATTVVRSGIGVAFLEDVQFAIEAVKNRVNREGGVCGRQLTIKYVDDAWRSDLGAQYIRGFIRDGVFAIPVGPSSEGLNAVIANGDIKRAGIPVVGTDGMIISQYTEPWVWPVAVSTASSARIMARNAFARGAKKFAIVFDRDYKFGEEAALAFNNEVRRLTGSSVDGYNSNNNCVRSFCGIYAGQPGYRNEVNTVSQQGFDFLAMFLEPRTALTWMATPGAPTVSDLGKPGMIGLAQPLFTRDFAVNCQRNCHQMWVWTGYKPPIEDYQNDPVVQTYVNDLHRTKRDADENNAFAQGGYVGMTLLVEALRVVGPQLTRARLRAVLNSLQFSSGLTLESILRWPSGNYFAAATMQAFEIQYLGSFGGWRAQEIVRDPSPQRGIG